VTSTLLQTRLSVDPTAFIARNAILVGDVSVGPRASVWFGAVLRGDLSPVRIGEDSNLQDGAIMHVEVGVPSVLGRRVTVGHGAIVHAASVEDDCLIGIAATILSGARVGRGSIIGAGAVVREGFEVPPGSVVFGVPGRVVRSVTEEEARRIDGNWRAYVGYAEAYRDGRII
jgi:carbonic anhydrase/acetyltransferase-like protein (isoleucine patch superfamily)